MSNTVPVKITVANNGTRRLNVVRSTTFDHFQQQVKELFGQQNEFDWIYLDEENDVVTFSTEQEWRDNLETWPSDKILKINATVRPVITRVEQSAAREEIRGCPFSARAGNVQGGCSAGFPARILLPLALFYAIFTHPFLSIIGLVSVLFLTRKNQPETYEKIKLHARTHWRKVAFVFGLRLLLSCNACALFFLVPIGFFAYRRLSKCHGGNYCGQTAFGFTTARDRIRNFINSHGINNCEDACKFACAVFQGKKCPAQAAQHVAVAPVAHQPELQRAQEVLFEKQPSAPQVNEIYPQVSDEVLQEATLPQRSEHRQYAGELAALEMMGFDNVKLNEHLLRNFSGDLDRVITSLLQLSAMK